MLHSHVAEHRASVCIRHVILYDGDPPPSCKLRYSSGAQPSDFWCTTAHHAHGLPIWCAVAVRCLIPSIGRVSFYQVPSAGGPPTQCAVVSSSSESRSKEVRVSDGPPKWCVVCKALVQSPPKEHIKGAHQEHGLP
eukprot:1136264-Pelagomonas_calceolata.AAC.9